MLGSIHTGLSGLNAFSRGLQQVGNNVTNLNTVGYKATTVTFDDMAATRDSGGTSLSAQGGGAGGGVALADPRIDFKPGELRQTSRDLDLAIDGTGFLVLRDGGETLYARTGSFTLDETGHVVLSGTAKRLTTLDAANQLATPSVDIARTSPPKATTTITLSDNLSSTAKSFMISDAKVYDANGGLHVWQLRFAKAETGTGWTVSVVDEKAKAIGSATLDFVQGVADPATAKLVFADADAGLSVTADFSGVTSFSSGDISTLKAATIDGHGVGTAIGVGVTAEGRLEISYSNGQKTDLGAVAIADFRDPQSLDARGDGVYADRGTSQRTLFANPDPRGGNVVSKRLEASNVDLSGQFGELILIQRGFQAASQIISVTNDMIQQLFGIRGQG